MVKASRRLVIDNAAKLQLKNAYNYIKKDAPQNAEKVKAKILASFPDLPQHPKNMRRINTG
jgi:plasmid stabilization system protein ParE